MSDTYVRETICSNCMHINVCKHMNDFLAIRKVIEDATIVDKGIVKHIEDIECVSAVTITCRHYVNNCPTGKIL